MKFTLFVLASLLCASGARAGEESLLPLRTWTTNIWMGGFATADLDGNGRQDVVTFFTPTGGTTGIDVSSLGPHGDMLRHCTVPDVALGDPAAGDFDGDGFEDLAFAYVSSVAVYRGGPDGVPVLWQTIPTAGSGNFPALAVADFDDDTWPDILVSVPSVASTTPLKLLRNTAGTGFEVLIAASATGWNLEELDLADLDGDGDLDVLGSERALDQVRVVLADASGTSFTSLGTWPVADAPKDIRALDLTGDGLMDAAVAAAGGTPALSCLAGTGGGSLGPASTTLAADSWGILDAGDIDGDGDADLVLGSLGHYTWSFVNTGALPLAAPTSIRTIFNANFALMTDVNGDGWRDLLAGGTPEQDLALVFGGPDGLQATETWPLIAAPLTLDAADFTGDGKADVLSLGDSTGHSLGLSDGHGDGSFGAPVSTALPGTTPGRQTAVGACNGDTLADVVVLSHATGGGSQLRLALSNGAAKTFTLGGQATDVAGPGAGPLAVDLDGDGAVEICLPLASGVVRVWHVNGSNAFVPVAGYPVPASAVAAPSWQRSVAGDLDEDGFLDLVFPAPALKKVFVVRGLAGGALGAATVLDAGPVAMPSSVHVADADMDGSTDVLATGVGGEISFWRGQAGMSFAAAQATPGSTRATRCGDIDADGRPDVMGVTETSAAFNPSRIVVQRGLGNGQFRSGLDFSGTGTRLALADFTSDGVLDVVVSGQNGSSGTPQDAERVGLYVTRPYTEFTDLGYALAGSKGEPEFLAWGWLKPAQALDLSVARAAPLAPAAMFIGLSQALLPFKGGTLVPSPDLLLPNFVTDITGRIALELPWPAGMPSGLDLTMQWWFADATGPKGFTASSALSAITP